MTKRTLGYRFFRWRYMLLLCGILGLLFRGWIYRHVVTYRSISQPTAYIMTNPDLIKLANSLGTDPFTDVDAGISSALGLTSQQLRYTTSTCSTDPNQLVDSHRTHCVGYAHFFSALCNHWFHIKGVSKDWEATVHRGQLYVMGINIHQFFHSPFFSNHDFVVIRHKKTQEIIAVDPTIHDYLFINRITFEP